MFGFGPRQRNTGGLRAEEYPEAFRYALRNLPRIEDVQPCLICGRRWFDTRLATKGRLTGACSDCERAHRPDRMVHVWSDENDACPGPRLRIFVEGTFLEHLMVARIRRTVWIYQSVLGLRPMRSHSFASFSTTTHV